MKELTITDNSLKNRFEADLGNAIAFIEYHKAQNYISLNHTFVPDSHRGQGIAGKLIKQVLDQLRDKEIKIVVICPVIKKYMETHPEYEGMLYSK